MAYSSTSKFRLKNKKGYIQRLFGLSSKNMKNQKNMFKMDLLTMKKLIIYILQKLSNIIHCQINLRGQNAAQQPLFIIINHIDFLMDIEHFISQPDQFAFDYQESNHQHLPSDLYDQQSQEPVQNFQGTPDQVLHQMLQKQDITDKPISDIISEAIQQYNLSQKKVEEFVRKVKKTKNILKRSRAKGRFGSVSEKVMIVEKKQYSLDQSSTEKDTVMIEKQIKKQRNRISAQISRDRKKNYVANLEHKNKELISESETLKLQNERLRKEICQRHKQSNEQKGKNGNKFMRLLVLLGIVFLFYILKDVLNFKGKKSNSMPTYVQICQHDEEISEIANLSDNKDIIEQINKQIDEINVDKKFEDHHMISKSKQGSIKDEILKKVVQIGKKTKQLLIPNRMSFHLQFIKNFMSL